MRSKTTAAGSTPSKPRSKGQRSHKAYSSRLLDRSVLLLKVLATGPVEKRLADFSEAGLHKSTAFRLLEALRRHHLVAVDEISGRYRLGLGLFELGMAAVSRLDVGQCAPPFLEALAKDTGESASLGIFEDPEVVHILRVESSHALRLPSLAGRRSPAYCTGIGKVILAHMEPESLDRYLREVTLKPRTPRTITDKDLLRADLKRVRSRGYSLDDEEIFPGLRCVAAPVFGMNGRVVAGLSVAGPISRMPKDSLPRFTSKVMAVAGQISERLGYQGARRVPVSGERDSSSSR